MTVLNDWALFIKYPERESWRIYVATDCSLIQRFCAVTVLVTPKYRDQNTYASNYPYNYSCLLVLVGTWTEFSSVADYNSHHPIHVRPSFGSDGISVTR